MQGAFFVGKFILIFLNNKLKLNSQFIKSLLS